MKYIYPVIFVLILSSISGAAKVIADTSAVSEEVTSQKPQATSEKEEKTGEKKAEIKEREENEDLTAVQEDYSLVPSIVSDSFQLYREEGAEAFVKSILKGSPLEGDESSAKELERMRAVERYYGKMLRHSFVSVLKVTSIYKRIYIILQFAKGPVFCSIDCYYTSSNTWVVPAFAFNTDIVKVFPDILLEQYLDKNIH